MNAKLLVFVALTLGSTVASHSLPLTAANDSTKNTLLHLYLPKDDDYAQYRANSIVEFLNVIGRAVRIGVDSLNPIPARFHDNPAHTPLRQFLIFDPPYRELCFLPADLDSVFIASVCVAPRLVIGKLDYKTVRIALEFESLGEQIDSTYSDSFSNDETEFITAYLTKLFRAAPTKVGTYFQILRWQNKLLSAELTYNLLDLRLLTNASDVDRMKRLVDSFSELDKAKIPQRTYPPLSFRTNVRMFEKVSGYRNIRWGQTMKKVQELLGGKWTELQGGEQAERIEWIANEAGTLTLHNAGSAIRMVTYTLPMQEKYADADKLFDEFYDMLAEKYGLVSVCHLSLDDMWYLRGDAKRWKEFIWNCGTTRVVLAFDQITETQYSVSIWYLDPTHFTLRRQGWKDKL